MKMLLRDIHKHLGTLDWFLIICVFAALAYGFMAIISATNFMQARPDMGNQNRIIIIQAVAIFIGTAAMLVLSKSDYMHVIKYWRILYALSMAMLLAVSLFGIGEAQVGNNSWFRIGPVSVQPSEFVKLTFIIAVAKQLDENRERINSPKNIIMLALIFLLPFGLILSAGDLGNGLIYACIFLGMCFAAGISLWYFLGAAFIITALSPLLWNWSLLFPLYRQNRILAGFNPMIDPEGAGYQALRSMHAIGSGGLFGHGWQQGPMTQWERGRVPAQWTDFIFSAIGEEFGFVGAMLVIIILTLVIVRIFMVSRRARNNVGSLICVGVMSMFIAQTVENIGMCLGMLPVIGITLPFFSYGGSSVLSALMSIGLVLSVNSRRNIYYFTRDENLDA